MRLPSLTLSDLFKVAHLQPPVAFFGCLSFEERCRTVPSFANSKMCNPIFLLEIKDPADGFPYRSDEIERRTELNRSALAQIGLRHTLMQADLLSYEDDVLSIIRRFCSQCTGETVILDITCLPKRFFALMIKKFMTMDQIKNLIVTYTLPGRDGYTPEHLTEDPMTCESLPGFSIPISSRPDILVISVGFEALNIRSLIDTYQDISWQTKFILSYPPDGDIGRRQWKSLYEIALGNPRAIHEPNIEVISAWDSEQVYRTLQRWGGRGETLALAPFGPKPHTLGMVLYAIERDCAIFYSQPKSYNPDYSRGSGESRAYLAKWSGISCWSRTVAIA